MAKGGNSYKVTNIIWSGCLIMRLFLLLSLLFVVKNEVIISIEYPPGAYTLNLCAAVIVALS